MCVVCEGWCSTLHDFCVCVLEVGVIVGVTGCGVAGDGAALRRSIGTVGKRACV